MSRERPLRGGCSCGRNTYIIEVPPNATEVAQVFFDRSTTHSKFANYCISRVQASRCLAIALNILTVPGWSQASPLSAWLRVPLAWYHSTTYAYFDDETHNSIRRLYTSPREENAKRHFCGFCGTPLSYWSESPPSEADYISLTLGSLSGSDLRDLDELGLLPKEALGEPGEKTEEHTPPTDATSRASQHGDSHEVVPWFESMLHGSSLGRVRRSRGKRQVEDGRVRIEWEIVELLPEDDSQSIGKRKLGDVESPDGLMDERQ